MRNPAVRLGFFIFTPMEKFLIAGLGNIGQEYAHTRHNIGFDIAEALVRKHNAFFQTERLAEVAGISLKGRKLVVIRPTTYMNLSGKAVKYWMDKEKIEVNKLLVLVDDLALPLSRIRLRGSGSPGGQNGLKDISATLLTDNYAKLRFGIGNDYPKGKQADFVLSKWKAQEIPVVEQKINRCVELVEDFVFQGLEKTMNLYNNLVFEL